MDKFIGLAGTGYWGRNILRNLYEMGVLHTVCDSNPSVLEEFRKNFPDVSYTNSFEDMLNNPEIKGIALATPAVTHFELAEKAILAGKDVFVEKPLAMTFKEGSILTEMAGINKRILMVGHILQYHPAVLKLKEMISSGMLGSIYYIYSNRLNIGKLRTEENVLWSFAPHDISVAILMAGSEPVAVTAKGGDYLNRGIQDFVLVSLEFPGQVKGHIFVSWLNPFKEQKLVITGSEAMAVFDDTSREKLFFYPHKVEFKEGRAPVAKKADFQVIPVENGEPLRRELEHFIDCIRERKVPLTDGSEGLRVLKVLECAQKALRK